VEAASDGLDHIRDKEKTVEAPCATLTRTLDPKLRKEASFPEEIDDLREDVERMARAGKTYKTDAEFERGAKVGPIAADRASNPRLTTFHSNR
jgi:hypothetical protein